MQRFFLVDASTEYMSLFCFELRRRPDGLYERIAENGNALFNDIDREQFFGNLNSLCITQDQIKAPKLPLKPAAFPDVAAEDAGRGCDAAPADVQEFAPTKAETVAHYTEQARLAATALVPVRELGYEGNLASSVEGIVDAALAKFAGCWASVPANSTGEEAYPCGKPTVGETGFCKDHQESV